MEQRVNIRFCVTLSKTPTETYEMMQIDYGNEILSRGSIFELFKQFKDSHEVLQDDPKSRRASTSLNADASVNGREMVTQDCRLTLRIMADEMNIGK
jgi:hypothetical protein